ncbi:MAG TPA: glycosyltransferase family 39 protein [Chthoniobacteraceae bacterium]|nr:glycosyltransferase family 39 protein [Chthoniobacteraceae bacterium]
MFKTTPRSLAWKLCALILLCLLGSVLCGRLRHPWTYNDDYNGAFWSQAARNFHRAGYFSTAGVPAPLYFGAPPIPADYLYVHHPTLLPAMALLDYRLLGGTEAAARAMPIFFSLLAAGLLWLLVARWHGLREGAFALAFFIAAPMELHYGQMVNFEAPELFFLLAALGCFHLWRLRHSVRWAAGFLIFCGLAMATDWQGYLLVILLAAQLLMKGPGRNVRMAAGLLLLALASGLAFLFQIHLSMPGAWKQLFQAFLERTSRQNDSGGAFTLGEWFSTEFTDLTTLYHPIAWLLAIGGAALALASRKHLSPREAAPLHIAVILFIIDAFYICALRNQSYIHDFASFYFLAPISIFAAYLVERLIVKMDPRWHGFPTAVCGVLAAALIVSGIKKLNNIDTQFCILDDDDSEPAGLMPDTGHMIERSFPPDTVVICNFDQYYSPLPFYAQRVMVNNIRDYEDWKAAVQDALPQKSGGMIWTGDPEAAALLSHLAPADMRPVKIDGIDFVLWRPDKL